MEHQKNRIVYTCVANQKVKRINYSPYSRSFANFRCLTILVSGRSNEALNLGALGLKIVQLR